MRILYFIFFSFIFSGVYSNRNFDQYFYDRTMRVDYYHCGDKNSEEIIFDEVKQEPYWGGSKNNLIDKADMGNYFAMVYDSASNQLIYSTGYSTLFFEYQTTEEAKSRKRCFSETVLFPYPRETVRLEIIKRGKENDISKLFQQYISPTDLHINKEFKPTFEKRQLYKGGDPENTVDIVVLPDGYTKKEMKKFVNDTKLIFEEFFKYSPYKENKEKFNVWLVMAFSDESGADDPRAGDWKNTLLCSTFNSLDCDRYLMTTDNKKLRDLAAYVPYDQICILVNTSKYGGGAIYNFYACISTGNNVSPRVLVHEFGHSFGGLADEYYTSEVSYQDMYSFKVEPWEPNLTTLVNFESKWKTMVSPGVPIPTPAEKENENKIGAFEGGGYVEKGIYRPFMDCVMFSNEAVGFCPVCKKALSDRIKFLTE